MERMTAKSIIFMKKLRFFPVLMCLLASCCFMACGDDDNDGGTGGTEDNGGTGGSSDSQVSTCYFEAQGERIDFKHAYYFAEEGTGLFVTVDFFPLTSWIIICILKN